MAEPAGRDRVPCTYEDCRFYFDSEKEMKRHKASQHDYCSRCDEDFENEECLLIHKIKSTKHIVCPLCGGEFRSEGGRDLHIRQNHPTEQRIKCPGKDCGRIFTRAAAFVSHIEKKECKGIDEERLVHQRAMKTMISSALKKQTGFPTPPTIGDDRSGIRISQKELQSRGAMLNQPSRKDDDVKSTTSTTLSLKHWPRLGEKNVPDKSEQESEYEPSDLVAFSQLSVQTKTKTAIETENQLSAQINEMNLASGHYSEVQPPVPGRFFGQEAVQFYRAYDPNWDPNKHLNPYTGKYDCCGGEFEDVKGLAEHLILHMGRNFSCPCCRRKFKSNAALVAHCETSTRCPGLRSEKYAQTLDEVSGGFVQAVGYHEDGTPKFEAGKVDQPAGKTIIGVDLNKVGW
ncbi:hypothetical protein VTN96DRAFT_6098 [Rasamsonia emersonii]